MAPADSPMSVISYGSPEINKSLRRLNFRTNLSKQTELKEKSGISFRLFRMIFPGLDIKILQTSERPDVLSDPFDCHDLIVQPYISRSFLFVTRREESKYSESVLY